MSAQEKNLDAAEYVIGTLSAAERVAFDAVISADPQTRADVHYWERIFGSLNASISPQAPPSQVWDSIVATLDQDEKVNQPLAGDTGKSASAVVPHSTRPANDNLAAKLQRSRSRWRLTAIAASIAALGLGAFILQEKVDPLGQGNDKLAAGNEAKQYIAVVNANGDQPSLVVNVDTKTGEIKVRSLGVKTPDGKSLELWYLPGGTNATSVGTLDGNALKEIRPSDGDILAISVEPVGGSPTGTATGPVIYTGKLIENVDAE